MAQVLANPFLIINLGCEMLYVIDQRLKAQCITLEKSTQGELKFCYFLFIHFPIKNSQIFHITRI